MIPVRTETFVDSIDVGEWFSLDLEEEPDDPEDDTATAVYLMRIGDTQFRIRAPYIKTGAIEVLAAQRVSDEPRTKWPDMRNLRPQVVRMRRRRRGEGPDEPDEGEEHDEAPTEPESA